MRVICRGPGFNNDVDIEDLFMDFLYESFKSRFLYVISPWITAFNFNRRIIYYPYVSSGNALDVIRALVDNGVDVRIITRCIDDSVKADVINLVSSIISGGISDAVPGDVRDYLRDQLDEIASNVDGVLRFYGELYDRVVFDLGANDALPARYRLHSKLYVNEFSVIVGSANFTRGGITEGGNWECIVEVNNGEELYKDLLNYAQQYLKVGRPFSECMRRTSKLLRDLSSLLKITVADAEDLTKMLGKLMSML